MYTDRKRWLAIFATCLGLVTIASMFDAVESGAVDRPSPTNELSPSPQPRSAPRWRGSLDDLAAGRLDVIDLTWPINNKSAYWPGANYKPFELHTIATLQRDGVLSKAFSMPEHLGTHIDAPNHFERRAASVDQIAAADFFAPGVLIDVSTQASLQPDYRLTAADILAWEKANGRIPDRAVVLLRTGWGRFWSNMPRYQGRDPMGRLHFPAYSPEAAELLVNQRNARGIGVDTLSVDYGLSRDFAVHHILGKANRYGLENLASLEKLPPRGFYLFVAPIKIETGTGGPTRVLAILEHSRQQAAGGRRPAVKDSRP